MKNVLIKRLNVDIIVVFVEGVCVVISSRFNVRCYVFKTTGYVFSLTRILGSVFLKQRLISFINIFWVQFHQSINDIYLSYICHINITFHMI